MEHTALASMTPAEAAKRFTVLLRSLEKPASSQDEKEKKRSEELIQGLSQGIHSAVRANEEHLGMIVTHMKEELTELERLLEGQRMMFAALASRVAARHLGSDPIGVEPHIFNELFEILDNLDSYIEGDALRALGVKPKPSAGPAAKKKAPKTYAQAQNEILAHLKKKGWTVVSHLKTPHATNPAGTFRYWFKPQAIYASEGAKVKDMGDARSIWSKDYRFGDSAEFAKGLEDYAK